jgi:anaerobic selenocysteine-containing dehydrogenase
LGPRTPLLATQWPVRVDQNVEEEPDRWVQACCFLCSNGCGIDIGVKDDKPGGRIVGVRGRASDVVNWGRLGPKGLHSWVANAGHDRLTRPLIRRDGQLEPASWDETMDLVVRRIKEAKEKYTAESIGFYTSGQLFAEENYTLSVIRTAGIGTLHIDGYTRLCTATAGAALLQIFDYVMDGSIRVLWTIGTNPAVSVPDLNRLRADLSRESVFVIVQDAFMTETAEMADVVLPAAIWGEKTGCSTNVDRVVHLNNKAVEPPGEARSDLDVFLDFARRMDFRDKDGAPLIKWADAEGAFNAWRECSRGRPCDYSGLSYAKLSKGSGIPWPCNDEHPHGSERYYADLNFATDPDYCESYGHDLLTGAATSAEDYRAKKPNGRAFLRAAEYVPPTEEPDEECPFFLTTGRVVYHFHTRTKTGRSKELREAAPDAFIQMNGDDARRLGVADGEMVRVTSRRGAAEAPARIGDIGPGRLVARERSCHATLCKEI